MSKRSRILLVANSVPLPETDFLKYKLFGLSKLFDVHFLCWDNKKNREQFYQKFDEELTSENILLFYDKLTVRTALWLVLLNAVRIIFTPHIAFPLLTKLFRNYNEAKKRFVKFTLYYSIVKLRPDVLHFEYGTLAQQFSDIKEYINCKTSVSFRGYDINYIGLEDETYYNDVWQDFDGFHFLGNDLKQRAIKRGYQEGKIEALIPPAIDTSYFKPSDTEKNTDGFVVLSVGRLVWKKGYEYGLQAIAQLKRKGVICKCKIVADGNYKQAILFVIQELGLRDDVEILSGKTIEEIKTEMEDADVFLHPAVSEGFSNAVLEAQAMGLPVIATSADGLAENIKDGETGFIVPVYGVNEMVEKLEWCYNNRAALKKMGAAGVDRVNEYFKVEDQIKSFEAFYNKLYDSAE